MGKRLEKTYRALLNEKKEIKPDELDVEKKADDKEMNEGNEAELNTKLKKGLNKLKGSKKPNPVKKLKENADKDEDDAIEESKETSADRVARGVPAKKDKLEEKKAVKESEDEDEDDVDGDTDPEEKDDDLEESTDTSLEDTLAESTKKAVSDMGDLLEGQGSLEESHKEDVKTLFEAALSDKTKIIRESLEAQYDSKLEEAVGESENSIIESLNTYLDKVVAEWLEENRMELEQSIRTELTESFLGAMKSVFEDHYVEIPEEKMDIVESILTENEEMEKMLNEELAKRIESDKELETYRKQETVDSLSEDLTLTERERLAELTEEVVYSDADTFEKKVKVIKENFFRDAPKDHEPEILNEDSYSDSKPISEVERRYGKAISSLSSNKFDTQRIR